MALRRSALAAAALAALAACASRPRTAAERPAAAAAPAAPAKPLFEPYPAAEVAALRSPHDYKGKPLCQRCHAPDGKLTAEPSALCAGCHALDHGNHPVNVVQRPPPDDLPLLAEGKVACHTCHDPHQRKSALRKPFDALCTSCHKRH
jgi:predicted CXXCH cytochrome family protein